MPKDPQEFAELFGARIVGEVPDVGGGPFGMARLAHIMHQRLTPSQGERPGRPTDATWAVRPKVPMSEATQRRLAEIAEQMSTPQRRVSPMQIAAQLLEEAVGRVQVTSATPVEEVEGDIDADSVESKPFVKAKRRETPDSSEGLAVREKKTAKQIKSKQMRTRGKSGGRRSKT